MRTCGRPRPPTLPALLVLALSLASAVVHAAPGPTNVSEWHRGHGAYPDATPPREWSDERNVVWKRRLDKPGNASPLVVGDRLYLTEEPTTLSCFDAKTGRRLWSKENGYLDSLDAPARRDAERRAREASRIERRYASLRDDAYRLKRRLRKDGGTPEAFARLQSLETAANALRDKLVETDRLRPLPDIEFIGYASSTPVAADGAVFAVFGNGVVAAYEPDGRRRWIRWVGDPALIVDGLPRRHAASPLVVGDVLVVPLGVLQGLDVRTGATRWTQGPYENFGSPVHLRVGERDVVATPAGTVVDARDGRLLTAEAGGVYYAGPVAMGDRLFFVGQRNLLEKTKERSSAMSIVLAPAADGLSAREGWRSWLSTAHYYNTPAVHDGRLYAVSVTGEFTVHDAATGQALHHRFLEELGKDGAAGAARHDTTGSFYARVSVAGGYVFLVAETGRTYVFTTGDHPEPVAVNELGENVRATPLFVGPRLYLRGFKHLYAVGR